MQVATRKKKGKQREMQFEKFKGKISSLDTIGKKPMMSIKWDNGDKMMSFALNDPAVQCTREWPGPWVAKADKMVKVRLRRGRVRRWVEVDAAHEVATLLQSKA
jgi:hypothetical protein